MEQRSAWLQLAFCKPVNPLNQDRGELVNHSDDETIFYARIDRIRVLEDVVGPHVSILRAVAHSVNSDFSLLYRPSSKSAGASSGEAPEASLLAASLAMEGSVLSRVRRLCVLPHQRSCSLATTSPSCSEKADLYMRSCAAVRISESPVKRHRMR